MLVHEHRLMRQEPALHALLREWADVPVPAILAHDSNHSPSLADRAAGSRSRPSESSAPSSPSGAVSSALGPDGTSVVYLGVGGLDLVFGPTELLGFHRTPLAHSTGSHYGRTITPVSGEWPLPNLHRGG